ncbi:MAG: ABC transporter permease [Bacteroidales bacterium]|jgi:ABC-2 type transport system permease protein|nr:ABC transporter permease [Bacteroidales bacterium]
MTVLRIMIREWRRILTLPVFFWLLLVLPPVLFFFYAFIYEKEKIKDLPFAIWDESHSAASRQLTFLLEQMESIHITHQIKSQSELELLILKGEVMGAVHFPVKMEEHILSGQPVDITLYTNASSLVPAKLLFKNASEVIIMGGAGITLEKLIQTGMNRNKAMALVQPVRLTTLPLYNPGYNYFQYLVPGLITVALQMIIIMVSVLLFNYETKTGSKQELYALARGSALRILSGKMFAHLGVAWINFILVTGIIFPIFGIGQDMATFHFFILYTLLAMACISIGSLISVIISDTMLATDIALFYTAPAFVFSGYTFPRWAMPWYDQFYAWVMPYSSFLDGFVKLYQMQLPFRYAFSEMSVLLLFVLVTFPLALLVLKIKIRKEFIVQ